VDDAIQVFISLAAAEYPVVFADFLTLLNQDQARDSEDLIVAVRQSRRPDFEWISILTTVTN